MIEDSNRQPECSRKSEIGVILGQRVADYNRLSQAYTVRELGYKGFVQINDGNKILKKRLTFCAVIYEHKYKEK